MLCLKWEKNAQYKYNWNNNVLIEVKWFLHIISSEQLIDKLNLYLIKLAPPSLITSTV
jgi:hypothetical protein